MLSLLLSHYLCPSSLGMSHNFDSAFSKGVEQSRCFLFWDCELLPPLSRFLLALNSGNVSIVCNECTGNTVSSGWTNTELLR